MVVLAALALAARGCGPTESASRFRGGAEHGPRGACGPEFQVDGSTEAVEGLWDFLVRLFFRITHSFRALLEWLYLLSPLLAWLFIGAVLVMTLAVLVGHIVWTIFMVLGRDRSKMALANALILEKVNPAELARQAESARAAGDYMLGVRLLFLALASRSGAARGQIVPPGGHQSRALEPLPPNAAVRLVGAVRLGHRFQMVWLGSVPAGRLCCLSRSVRTDWFAVRGEGRCSTRVTSWPRQ